MNQSANEPTRASAVYNAALVRHFRQPENAGTMDIGRQDVGFGEAGRQQGGCRVQFYLRIGAAGRIVKSRYRVFGCPVAIATCSLLSSCIVGWAVDALSRLEVQSLLVALEPPAEKRGVLLVVEDAIRAAAHSYLAARTEENTR
jgi:nitrogen fixation NifU-like protein